MSKRHKLFLSYSHKDKKYRTELSAHLKMLERYAEIDAWTDQAIGGGAEWRKEIETAIRAADVCLLLVSQHSLTSDFICNEEVEPFLRRHRRIYPILVRDCDWKTVDWLKARQIRPEAARPLNTLRPAQRDTEFRRICEEIRGILKR